MSIYSEIDRLELAKQNIKLKLESKGIIVPANARISDYAALINLLPEIKESEFTNRIVDNGNSGTGKTKIYNIKGKSLIWNQLVHNGNFADGTTNWFASNGGIAANGGILTYRVSIPNEGQNVKQDQFPDIANHKYLFRCELNYSAKPSSTNTGFLGIGGYYGTHWNIQSIVPNSWFQVSGIITSTGQAATKDLRIYFRTTGMSAGDTVQIKNIIAIDLTLMFGEGNEPSSVAEFKTIFSEAYYPYNACTPINNDAEAIESIGFNQWDEEWENGAYSVNTGEKIASDGIRSKNYIRVLPNTTYYPKRPNGTTWIAIMAYNSNKEFIQSLGGLNDEFITPLDCYYITFYTPNAYSTYNNDICINHSDPAKNGTYEPYKKVILSLGLNSFNVKDSEDNIITINGLKSAGNVYDEIVRNNYIKRIGEADLGTLNWQIGSGSSAEFNFFYASFVGPTQRENIICNKYNIGVIGVSSGVDKSIAFIPLNQQLRIRDLNYNTVAALQTALSGVILYYELATPIEYELVDEIDTIYDVDKNGVERIISPVHADGSPSAPFRASIGYPVNQEQ